MKTCVLEDACFPVLDGKLARWSSASCVIKKKEKRKKEDACFLAVKYLGFYLLIAQVSKMKSEYSLN